MVYKLKKDGHIAVTDKEYKREQFIALGFIDVTTEKNVPVKKATQKKSQK